MANKRKYHNKAEYDQAMQRKRNAWNQQAYRRLSVSLPRDLAAALDERVKAAGVSKRQYIINLIEAATK